jgi:hypothetical protein
MKQHQPIKKLTKKEQAELDAYYKLAPYAKLSDACFNAHYHFECIYREMMEKDIEEMDEYWLLWRLKDAFIAQDAAYRAVSELERMLIAKKMTK